MDTRFKLKEEDFDYISKLFEVEKDGIKELCGKHKVLKKMMREQYLAHVIRSLEEYIRKKKNKPKFTIICRPSTDNKIIKDAGCATYDGESLFTIVYDSQLEGKQARTVIAHELGHLFSSVIFDKHYGKNGHEPYSSVFGILTIVEKNDFYVNQTKPFVHKSCKEIIDEFSLLKNRAIGILNLS